MLPADFLPALEDLTDHRTVERGRGYFREGRVSVDKVSAERIDASIAGSGRSVYRAHLRLDLNHKDGVDFACDCPVGETGDFCKHLVALALTWPTAEKPVQTKTKAAGSHQTSASTSPVSPKPVESTASIKRKGKVATEISRIDAWLDVQDAAKLRVLWREVVLNSAEARQYLLAKAAAGSCDPQALSEAVSELLKRRGGSFLDYHGSGRYAQQIDPVVDLLRGALAGNPDGVLKIAEKTIKRLNRALLTADDSNGSIGGVLHACQEVWCEALIAQTHRPAKARAGEFIKFDDDQEFFGYGFYVPLEKLPMDHPLTHALYARSRELVAAGIGGKNDFNQRRRAKILAERVGDIDVWIALELADGQQHANVVTAMEKLDGAGRRREALALGERYLKRKDVNVNKVEIRIALAKLLHADGFTSEAIEHVWTNFNESPSALLYRALMRFLQWVRSPADEQDKWREQALQLAIKRGKRNTNAGAQADDVTVAVEILMVQQRYEDAWSVWRIGTEVTNSVAHSLARDGAKQNPARALKIVAEEATYKLDAYSSTNNATYDYVAVMLRDVRDGCFLASAQAAKDWTGLVEKLRDANIRKPNFVRRMNELLLEKSALEINQ